AIAALWMELLKLDRVGRHDNFFALGGHSLMAIKVAIRLRATQPHASITMLDIFANPTLIGLAAVLLSATTHPPPDRHIPRLPRFA
ncbi:phosphopantetheine-binding protein, partial [Granulicella aggregans]|uniref:phosphopantetheine-binding protein n=1 Tax=Granulicella aggregans TaxID=474949 RepID=UPI00162181DE